MKKKTISSLLLGGILALSSFGLVGCGESASIDFSDTIKADVTSSITGLVSHAYNNSTELGTNTTYSVAELNEELTNDITYYVNVGELKNFDTLSSVTFGDAKYNTDSTFKLSIGNNNFIEDKIYYVDDNDLFISSVIINFEGVKSQKIKLNKTEIDFDIYQTADTFNFSEVKWETGSGNTIAKVENKNEYNLGITNGTKYLAFYYTGATSTNVVLTKKTLTGGTASYGLTKVEAVTGNPYAFYPVGYVSDLTTTQTNFDNKSMDLSIYVIGKGVANVKLNYDFPPV